jgi:hypothetical protein
MCPFPALTGDLATLPTARLEAFKLPPRGICFTDIPHDPSDSGAQPEWVSGDPTRRTVTVATAVRRIPCRFEVGLAAAF